MQIKNLQDTIKYLRDHMLNTNEATESEVVNQCEEVNPITIRKTPKFPSRDRHLAIRRRKQPSSPDSQRSESLNFSVDSDESNEAKRNAEIDETSTDCTSEKDVDDESE
jgi:hypothetical protein